MKIRPYVKKDAREVGQLIAKTYSQFNLDFAPPEERGPLLGPFQYADSDLKAHQQAIAEMIQATIVLVAENDKGEIIGVLRGREERLHSLFVHGDNHRQGIGSALLEIFEGWCREQDCQSIRLASTLYAVPFYQRMGYKKSTGLRRGWSFEGEGLVWQPMKKRLLEENSNLQPSG